ncbi:MAG: methytransferase partner Trm112 [Dehalococcoidia bacterium]|nr:methytransferase partner Trm112 [Dehalococcoidia bacterium]
MRRELVDILVCPTCKGHLDLKVFKETEGDIVEGRFDCDPCNVSYPIDDGIPNMLPPDLRD